MKYNKSMEATTRYYRQLNVKFFTGFDHGSKGKRFQPDPFFGAFRKAYIRGYMQGMKIKAK